MLLRQLDNGEIEFPITIEELQQRFPHISFAIPITDSALPEGYRLVHFENLNQGLIPNPDQKIDVSPPVFENDKWVQRQILRSLTEQELTNLKYEKIQERNRLLLETDWSQLPDVPKGTAEKYLDYRQRLRDITKDPQFPFVTFPEV